MPPIAVYGGRRFAIQISFTRPKITLMKKLLIVPLLALVLMVPGVSHAQTVSSDQLQAQLITLLQQYITILQAQIAQLQALQSAQDTQATTTTSTVNTGTESQSNVGSGTTAQDPVVSYEYDKDTGVITYTGTYPATSENFWFSYRPVHQTQAAWNKTGVTVVDSNQVNGQYIEHLSLSPSVQSQLQPGTNTVLMIQARFPSNSFFSGTSLEFDPNGNQVTFNSND